MSNNWALAPNAKLLGAGETIMSGSIQGPPQVFIHSSGMTKLSPASSLGIHTSSARALPLSTQYPKDHLTGAPGRNVCSDPPQQKARLNPSRQSPVHTPHPRSGDWPHGKASQHASPNSTFPKCYLPILGSPASWENKHHLPVRFINNTVITKGSTSI